MAIRNKAKVIVSEAAYIDPAHCDSVISYKVVNRTNLYGSVKLTDCNRSIEWYFNDSQESVEKIERAILQLDKFRTALIEARNNKPKKRKRRAR